MESIYSVTRLNGEIKGLLESNPSFHNIFVQGEISNYKAHTSGHYYMTLKDDGAAVSAVMFHSNATRLRFRPENGMLVIARGRIGSFPKTGQVQLYITDMMPDGAGALHMAFEQLKEKLYAEGLFDTARKRSLPRLPQVIALITSPTGAAVQDMLRIMERRWPVAKIELHPALVQGADAPADLCRALHEANDRGAADLIVIGRGGGSIEDLWAFNDERVARALYLSEIPVVSAVGHEPDVTIADFVADLRASTPSGAAELVTPDLSELYAFLKQAEAALQSGLCRAVSASKQRYMALTQRLNLCTPKHFIEDQRMLLGYQAERMLLRAPSYKIAEIRTILRVQKEKTRTLTQQRLAAERSRLSAQIAALDALSPLKVLMRGYSVALDETGNTVRDSAQLKQGDQINVRFAQGSAQCIVTETRNEK